MDSLWGEQSGTSASNVGDSNGNLTLTATGNSSSYTGAEISSSKGFSFLYGYAEASIKMPGPESSDQGMWPAFWMLPEPTNGVYHDGDGEIDIMEVVDGQNADNVHLHHSGYTTAGAALNTGVDLSAGYHTYAVDWEPGSLTFYFDGKVAMTCTGSIVPDVAEYLIFDLWVGGSWPGSPNSSTLFPNTMDVDWVRVWQTSASTDTATASSMSAQPTSQIAASTESADTSLIGQLPDATGAASAANPTSASGTDSTGDDAYNFVNPYRINHRQQSTGANGLTAGPLSILGLNTEVTSLAA